MKTRAAVAAMQAAIETAQPEWGTACLLGNTAADARLSIHPTTVLGGRKIVGGTFGGVMGRSGLPAYADMAVRGEIELKPFVTHRLRLEELNHGVDLMRSGESIRSVVVF